MDKEVRIKLPIGKECERKSAARLSAYLPISPSRLVLGSDMWALEVAAQLSGLQEVFG